MNQLARPLARTRPAVLPRQADRAQPPPPTPTAISQQFLYILVLEHLKIYMRRERGERPPRLSGATGAESEPNKYLHAKDLVQMMAEKLP